MIERAMRGGKIMSKVKLLALLHLGVILIAVGVYFFKFQRHFVMGGVSGYAIILGKTTLLSASDWTAILNGLMLLLGLSVYGKRFAALTTYASILLSGLIWTFSNTIKLDKPLSNEPLLELVFAIVLPAIGSAILFNIQASGGGTDIPAMILRDKAHIDVGRGLILSDIVAAFIAIFVFDVQTSLFSFAGLFAKGIFVDQMIEGVNQVKAFTVITTKPEEIGAFITTTLHRGATRILGQGVYSGQTKTVLLCVVSRRQAVILRDYIRELDPQAFFMISSTSEIIGRGFHSCV